MTKITTKQVPTGKTTPKAAKVDETLGKKIVLLADKNPKREGSASHTRFAIYKAGMTVAAYVEACVKAGSKRRAARADIDWDTKHKFIEVK